MDEPAKGRRELTRHRPAARAHVGEHRPLLGAVDSARKRHGRAGEGSSRDPPASACVSPHVGMHHTLLGVVDSARKRHGRAGGGLSRAHPASAAAHPRGYAPPAARRHGLGEEEHGRAGGGLSRAHPASACGSPTWVSTARCSASRTRRGRGMDEPANGRRETTRLRPAAHPRGYGPRPPGIVGLGEERQRRARVVARSPRHRPAAHPRGYPPPAARRPGLAEERHGRAGERSSRAHLASACGPSPRG
jgi:hypothetical protein